MYSNGINEIMYIYENKERVNSIFAGEILKAKTHVLYKSQI